MKHPTYKILEPPGIKFTLSRVTVSGQEARVTDCAWAVNLLGDLFIYFALYNIHILSIKFFSSSALNVREFIAVHIPVSGNAL